jgi:adenylylsulfate kinase
MIVQIIGLPGSGKTTFATALADKINAIHLNADYIRSTVNSDLSFTIKDRIEHSRRLGEMARMISWQGHNVVVDFVCPTKETREAFGKSNIFVWMNTVQEGRFEDTNKLWQIPTKFDIEYKDFVDNPHDRAKEFCKQFNLHDWSEPTTLMLGRYQPWHEGHHALYVEAGKKTNQVMLGVRNTYNTSPKDPLTFNQVKEYIAKDSFMDGAMVIKMPNITNIVYGRDVGYKIEQVKLGEEIESISATQKRKELGI